MKLYVLVRGDLTKSQQAVQACHAVSVFCSEHNLDIDWKNQTMVLLRTKDFTDLLIWRERIASKKQLFSEFKEPDIGNETTAVAAYGSELEDMLARLSLL